MKRIKGAMLADVFATVISGIAGGAAAGPVTAYSISLTLALGPGWRCCYPIRWTEGIC